MLLVPGFFLDQLAILDLTLPIIFPILIALDFDAAWLGIMIIKTVEIGLITPPLGLNCLVVSSATGFPVHGVFRGVWIFVAIDFAVLILLATFPDLSLALPRSAGLLQRSSPVSADTRGLSADHRLLSWMQSAKFAARAAQDPCQGPPDDRLV